MRNARQERCQEPFSEKDPDTFSRGRTLSLTSAAAVALAWLVARPSITAPIVSATDAPQLQTLIPATRLALDAAAIDLLNRVWA